MLVLSRKLDQDIIIGDNIRIRILKIKGNTIRLGVEAPRDVKVVRGELPSNRHDQEVTAAEDHQATFKPKTAPTPEAEITIVFSNEKSKNRQARQLDDVPSNSGPNSNHQRVLPFQRMETSDHRGTELNRQNSTANKEETVRFRTPLPMSLQHNRLKELVKELTRNNPS